jgi:hypothetical protein
MNLVDVIGEGDDVDDHIPLSDDELASGLGPSYPRSRAAAKMRSRS